MKFKRLLVGLVVAALVGCGGVWAVGSLLVRSTNSEVDAPASPARQLRIDSSPGIHLAATYWPAGESHAPALLLLHGNGNNRGSMHRTAQWLNARGYAILTIDFRGHGQSTPAQKSFGLFEAEDARAALSWLRRENPGARIGVIGFSLGGAAMLIGRGGPLPVDALVLEAVYPDIRHAIFNRLAARLGRWPATLIEPMLSYQSLLRLGVWPSAIAPIRALAQVKEPVMIIGGGDDASTLPDEARAMYETIKTRGEFHILPGVSHDALGRNLPDDFKQTLLDFLDKNLKDRH